MTPSQAKNAVSKALLEIIDPPLKATEERRLRAFFQNKCAYCGRETPPGGRTGHIDHLVPRQQGGTNHPSNLVLACNICNGDEKLDQSWQDFMAKKVFDKRQRQERIARIQAWISQERGPVRMSEKARASIHDASLRIAQAIDSEVEALREMRSKKAFGKIVETVDSHKPPRGV